MKVKGSIYIKQESRQGWIQDFSLGEVQLLPGGSKIAEIQSLSTFKFLSVLTNVTGLHLYRSVFVCRFLSFYSIYHFFHDGCVEITQD